MKIGLLFLSIVFLSAMGAYAQNNSSLSGTVLDATGAIVPGATVKLTSHEQGTVRTSNSNEAGVYQFSFLPAGVYDVEIGVPGFKTLVQKDVTLAVAQNIRRDFKLELGNISENLTVAANVETVNTESA